jgi:hypothetical protein
VCITLGPTLIVAIGGLACGLFCGAFRCQNFYIMKPEVNIGGQVYPTALLLFKAAGGEDGKCPTK